MPGRMFPVEVPNVRKGGDRTDPADVGPTFDGDQKYNRLDGSLVSSHNGGQYPHSDRPTSHEGRPLQDKFTWMEE